MPQCDCLGGNPDCYKCGGWGWIGDDIQRHRMGDMTTDTRVRCPYCEKMVNNPDLHVSQVHREKCEEYLLKISPRTPKRCSMCGDFVIDLMQHYDRVHSQERKSTDWCGGL